MNAQSLLVLGTSNRKKGEEMAELLAPAGWELRTLADFPQAIQVPEGGDTFAANATAKATQQAIHLGQWVVADDSGLMVDALGGAPGVLSARYGGPGTTDEQNNRKLLEDLSGVPAEQRTAQFVCHMVLADPAGTVRGETRGHCCGRIRFQPQGTNGFGYDPLFEILAYHQTFAELGPVAKSVLSHRARAARQMIPILWALGQGKD